MKRCAARSARLPSPSGTTKCTPPWGGAEEEVQRWEEEQEEQEHLGLLQGELHGHPEGLALGHQALLVGLGGDPYVQLPAARDIWCTQ